MTEAEELAQAVERLVSVIARQRKALGDVEPSPLTTTQGLALSAVARERSMRLRTLAEAIGTTDATASRTVDVLESLGLVERRNNPNDRRGVVVAVTPEGRRTWRRRHQRLVTLVDSLVADLNGRDRARFVALLTDLNELLRDQIEPEKVSQAAGRPVS